MATYAEGSLTKGENIRYVARVSLWNYWFNFFGGLVLLIGALYGVWSSYSKLKGDSMGSVLGTMSGIAAFIAVIILIWPLLARRSTELVITDRRVVVKLGLISTHSIEIRFEKIETVRVTQGLLGRMLNFGDIIITGTGSTFDPIPDISSPLAFRAALNDAMSTPSTGASPLS